MFYKEQKPITKTESKTVFFQILSYLSDAYRAHLLLSEHLGGHPFHLWMERNVEQIGKIRQFNLKYAFHGVGCSVQSRTVTVDFDYSSNGEIGTFNRWCIFEYMDRKHMISDKQAYELAYDQLCSQGIIVDSRVELGREHKLSTPDSWISVYNPG